jgi:uncharacterized RDD family membrane protein YckC
MVNAPPPPSWASQQQAVPIAEIGPPAGFWIRFLAYLVDGFILLLALIVIGGVIVGLVIALGGSNGRDSEAAIGVGIVFALLIYFVVGWLYEALLTSGPHGATFGKQAVGVRIVQADGGPLSFGRATGRHFLKVLVTPMVPLAIGYMLAGWTKGKRALHDFMADTLVIKVR